MHLDTGRGRLSLDAAQQDIFIERQRLYAHATLRVNYTTYDIRRNQDTVNVNNGKSDIMLLSAHDDEHPFRYARVLRVWHAHVSHPVLAPRPVRVELLWVRWFEPMNSFQQAWDRKELNKLRFVSASEDDAFGFVDPSQVLRACHITPSFADGRTRELLGPSIFRPAEGDWSEFYISQYVFFVVHLQRLIYVQICGPRPCHAPYRAGCRPCRPRSSASYRASGSGQDSPRARCSIALKQRCFSG